MAVSLRVWKLAKHVSYQQQLDSLLPWGIIMTAVHWKTFVEGAMIGSYVCLYLSDWSKISMITGKGQHLI